MNHIHSDHVPLPVLVRDLIAQLAATYPPRCIGVGEDPIHAHRYAAQVELVQELVELLREDEEAQGTPGD